MVDGVDDRFSLVNRLKALSLCFTMPIGKEAADEIERLQERVRELETALVRHADQIAQRIPGDLVPEEVSWPNILTAVSELKSQRNNADYRVAELEAHVRTVGAEALEKMAAEFGMKGKDEDAHHPTLTYFAAAEECRKEASRLRGEG